MNSVIKTGKKKQIFSSTIKNVSDLNSHFFLLVNQVWGKAGHQYMHKCLQTMCDLRSTHHFAFINEVDKCIGEAIKTMGPRIVLDAVPFQITGEE